MLKNLQLAHHKYITRVTSTSTKGPRRLDPLIGNDEFLFFPGGGQKKEACCMHYPERGRAAHGSQVIIAMLAVHLRTDQNYPNLPPWGNRFFGCLRLLCLLEACVIWLFRRRKPCLLVFEHLASPDLTWSFSLVISAAVLMSRAW
jgi:hypothetical protein